MKELIKVFEALGDETRVRILKILKERKNLCVCEITQALNISQTRASRNLGILEEAGFVTSTRKGVWVHYSLNKFNGKGYCKSIEKLLGNWINEDSQIIKDRKKLKNSVKLCNGRIN